MSDTQDAPTQAEIASLRGRVAELEQALAASRAREQELREGQVLLRYMLEGSNDAAWDWNIVTGEVYTSPRWFEMLGYTPDELPSGIGKWEVLLHPEDAPRAQAIVQSYVEGRLSTYEIEARMRHRSGKWLWTRSHGSATERDERGRVLRLTGVAADITAYKEAEEALRRSQALLRGLVENSPAVIYIKDLQGRILFVNKGPGARVSFSPEHVLGEPALDIEGAIPPEVVEQHRKNDMAVLESGKPISVEEVAPGDGELRTFLSIKFPLVDDQGKIFALGGISTDMTEIKRAEQERAALQAEVIEAQRKVLRELSTPLIPIAEGVVVMPLVGAIDAHRAQLIMAALLEGVAAHRAATVILDVTGVEGVDAQITDGLVQAARAVRLLGARVLMTGVRPEVARILVEVGAELGGIMTHGALQSGIAYALRRKGARRGRG